MKSKIDGAAVFPEDPTPVVLAELAVRPLQSDERDWAAQLLNAEHYLGAGRRVGLTLTQVVHHHGRWVALLDWGPAALKLTDREAWIGWFDGQRAERLGLLVQNRRFLVLSAIAKQQGTFYVADSARGSVVAFDESGRLLFETTNHLERPSGLVILSAQIFVADAQRHRIVVFDLLGSFRTEFGRRGKGEGEFNFPTHLAADREGNLYVTDSMNGRVQILDAEGHFKAQVGTTGDSPGHFGRPKGVSVDGFGHIYAIDALFDNIQIFDRTGQLLLNLGASGSRPGEFWLPNGITVSGNNEIYVTDTYNHRVQVFKYVGPL